MPVLNQEIKGSNPLTVEDTDEHSLVLSPWLHIGDKFAAKDFEFIQKARIRNIINCTPERMHAGLNNFFKSDKNIKYHRVPIEDNSASRLLVFLEEALVFLDKAASS